jgi:hypothetical protein
MRARHRTTILPAMPLTEIIETTRIHRVASLTGDRRSPKLRSLNLSEFVGGQSGQST